MPFMNLVGANPLRRTTAKEYNLGTTVADDLKQSWVYVQAPAAVAASAVVILTEPAMTVATGAGAYTNAAAAFAAGEYGWVRKTASPF